MATKQTDKKTNRNHLKAQLVGLCQRAEWDWGATQSDKSPSKVSSGLKPLAARSMAFTHRPLNSSLSALKV